MGTFLAGMGILVTVVLFMIFCGEDRFNAMARRFRCAHQYKCLDSEGKVDNDNPCIAKCSLCGKTKNIKE